MKAFHFNGAAPYYTNSFMLVSEKNNAVIIDPAADASTYQQALKECGATLAAIVCTHGHFDHVTSATQLRDAYGAILYCNPEDTRGNRLFPLAVADKGLAEGNVIAIDEIELQVWRTPGHSQGGVCLKYQDLFFTGDTLFHGSIGRTDLEGSDPNVMLLTLRKLVALGFPGETQILPGHEAFSTYENELKTNWHLQNGCR